MRPPSYYNSIVRSNHTTTGYSYSSADYEPTPRTSSQQLRSSLSSPSSSSYVSRSHLPFVPQSTLVAHCFTGVGSSTRPYGATGGGSSTSYRSGGGGGSSGNSAYISSSSLASSGSYSSLSVRQNSSKRPYASSNYSPGSSSMARPSYLSPSSITTSRYRPTTTLSSYYKPIRLRERPLLNQISRQIASPTPPPPLAPAEDAQPGHSKSGAAAEAAAGGDDVQADDWSRDIGRNISRNKYLIKFREIDKPNSASRPALDVEATIELPAARDSSPPEALPWEVGPPAESLPKATKRNAGPKSDLEPAASAPDQAETKRDKKEPEEMRLASEDQAAAKKAPAKKEKRNVKLRVRQVGAAKSPAKSSNAEASTTTTIIDKKAPATAKSVQPVQQPDAPALAPAPGPNPSPSSSPAPGPASVEPAKPVKAKRPAKPKEDKENRLETPTVDATSKAEPKAAKLAEPAPPPAASVKTKKRTKKEVADEPGPTSASPKPRAAHKKAPDAGAAGQQRPPGDAPVAPAKKAGRIRFREYNYNDFNFLTVLGHGGWGFVILAELKAHDACFAVKCIKKITIVEDDDYDSIMIERKVLALGNIHPFICKLFCTFETPGYLFFVMEYCAGGDLMFHVQHEGKFTESRCRFYAAEIICAIRFLHNRHIIYRALTPMLSGPV